METENKRAVNYLLTVLVPDDCAEGASRKDRLFSEVLQEVRTEEAIHAALDSSG